MSIRSSSPKRQRVEGTDSSLVNIVLARELQDHLKKPHEGYNIQLADDSNLLVWDVGIFGPPKTVYEGAYLKAEIVFPPNYPYEPPKVKFISKMFHPNVYGSDSNKGEVCISILHPPVDDPTSGERPEERWNPTQNVSTIMLSIISLLNEPNLNSPANVDASVMYRDRREEYNKLVKELVKASAKEAEEAGIVIPMTVEEYTSRSVDASRCDDFNDSIMNDYDDDDDNDSYGNDDDIIEDFNDDD